VHSVDFKRTHLIWSHHGLILINLGSGVERDGASCMLCLSHPRCCLMGCCRRSSFESA
jgi:hypothetical protein